ncbi:unnamed protein product [Cuscuta campestris]|uniref:F-box domain-containing protein n=1 Tax=Cuscuta campestris TaxID=132261 RepID=A0A484N3W3_9ASTE|nr:unnamed protein product [Cuscuta campestris]
MASSLLQSVRSKPAQDDDMISQLPDDLKHRILEFLDTREAARIALLSKEWKGVWLSHGRLVFDWDFTEAANGAAFVKMVSQTLTLRSGPVNEFTLVIRESGFEPTQSDLGLWCGYLSRNGIVKLDLLRTTDDAQPKYKLPDCIFSCPTIKHLTLYSFTIDFPDNARFGSVFSCLTSLVLVDCVVSMPLANGTAPSFPNLEKLVFHNCVHIENLLTSVRKLKFLGAWDQRVGIDWEWFKSRFQVVRALCIAAKLLLFKNAGVAKPSFPTALNLRALRLYNFSFAEETFNASIQLLKQCPNLHVLKMTLEVEPPSHVHAGETISRMLENPSSLLNDHGLCELGIVEIGPFAGSRQEMVFVKAILSKTPALVRLIIKESYHFE